MTEEQQHPQTHQVAVAGSTTMEPRVPAALAQHEQQTTGQSVWAQNVNSFPLDKMLKVVVMVVQQIMTESNGSVFRGGQNIGHYIKCLKSQGAKWPLEFIGPSKS
jgi:hypothetical protein